MGTTIRLPWIVIGLGWIAAFGSSGFLKADPIVADHTVVDQYGDIPQVWIDEVKKMLVDLGGESHASGYRIGLSLLSQQDARFAVTAFTGAPPAHNPTDPRLRFGGFRRTASGWGTGFGEATFYTNASAIQGVKDTIQYCNVTMSNPLAVIGFGWCWDMTWHNAPGGTRDPVHGVRWAGSSEGGPQGDLRWGLDAEDEVLTGNTVCMDTYLNAVDSYRQFCQLNGYPTVAIFTTGPVDGNGGNENGFQREVKHDYIRAFIQDSSDRILYDYADILCWSNAGLKNIATWNDGGTLRSYAQIHPDNMLDLDGTYSEDGDHIGQRGAIRLAKGMWWLLARVAGWDGASFPARPRELRIRRD